MNSISVHDVVQAGFLRRWAALFLDQMLLSVAFYAVIFAVFIVVGVAGGMGQMENMDPDNPPPWVVGAYLGMGLLYYVAAGLYFSLMESSSSQATLGKMALSIKVVDRNGARLPFAHALGRWFATSLSYLTFYIGFLMAAFTQEKRALHDYVAGTCVVDKFAYTDRPELQQRKPSGCLIAVFAAIAAFMILMVLGILAAIAIPAYQQYATRAGFVQVEASANAWKSEVETALQGGVESGGEAPCPKNGDTGFGTPESYAAQGINRVVFGEFNPGLCGISIWVPPSLGNVEQQILLEHDPEEQAWYCTTTLSEQFKPGWCK